jgi:transposase
MKPIILDKKQRAEIEKRRRENLDKRIYARLSAVVWVADGRERPEVAALLSISVRQLTDWLRIFRNQGLAALCVLRYKGDPGNLTPRQVEQLKEKIAKGHFRSSQQIQQWLTDTFVVTYSSSGVKDLLRRIGASYHKVSPFLWKGSPDKQRAFVQKVRRHQREAKREEAPLTRRYYVDACHPIWGMDLVFCCWLLVGQRFLVGVGSGRQRLNILGAYCPDDQEYLDLRLTRGNINGEQFVNLLRLLYAIHPETEKFILYVDGAKYYQKPVVKEWLARHPQFHLVTLPAYSPNCNLIERLWKLLRKEAFNRWHKTFEAMQAAVSEVLDHLPNYRRELETLMTETFHILKKQDIPVEYQEAS